MKSRYIISLLLVCFIFSVSVSAQIGRRFPSEKKVVYDKVTNAKLVFLTSEQGRGDSKIYQTHNQWTSDGKWLIFRSSRVPGEALAVNEESGDIVQVTEGGYTGMLNVARKSMKLYFMRNKGEAGNRGWGNRSVDIVEVDLEKVFADSKSGKMKEPAYYQKVCGTTPVEMGAGGDMALDGDEEWVYFRVGKSEAAKYLPDSVKPYSNFGPRNMGAGPAGIAAMNLKTGKFKHVVSVPFQVGHIQTNPWVAGEIVFCWETGGKSPQRTWIVNSDGTGLRPLYRESDREWVTHEAVFSKDEVAIAIMGHRKINVSDKSTANKPDPTNPGQEAGWGDCGTREFPTGLGVVNIRTREMLIEGQTTSGSGFWHVNGSADGKWLAGDDFSRSVYVIDRKTKEMRLLTTGHKATASDHPHPTFSHDGTRIQIQSALLSEDNKSMNICIVHLPEDWLKR